MNNVRAWSIKVSPFVFHVSFGEWPLGYASDLFNYVCKRSFSLCKHDLSIYDSMDQSDLFNYVNMISLYMILWIRVV